MFGGAGLWCAETILLARSHSLGLPGRRARSACPLGTAAAVPALFRVAVAIRQDLRAGPCAVLGICRVRRLALRLSGDLVGRTAASPSLIIPADDGGSVE